MITKLAKTIRSKVRAYYRDQRTLATIDEMLRSAKPIWIEVGAGNKRGSNGLRLTLFELATFTGMFGMGFRFLIALSTRFTLRISWSTCRFGKDRHSSANAPES
jgi:hypothetical protein